MESGARQNKKFPGELGNHRPVSLKSLQGITETTVKYRIIGWIG